MPICPRCRLDIPDEWHIWPVSLCLPCYAMIPENRELSYLELQAKAKRSRYASRRSMTERRESERARWNKLSLKERVAEHETTLEGQRWIAQEAENMLSRLRNKEAWSCRACNRKLPRVLQRGDVCRDCAVLADSQPISKPEIDPKSS